MVVKTGIIYEIICKHLKNSVFSYYLHCHMIQEHFNQFNEKCGGKKIGISPHGKTQIRQTDQLLSMNTVKSFLGMLNIYLHRIFNNFLEFLVPMSDYFV